MTQPVAGDLADLNAQLGELVHLNEGRNDSGNMARFIRLCGDRVRYLPEEDTWLVWDGVRLKRDDSNMIMHLTSEVCEDVARHVQMVDDDERRAWQQFALSTGNATARSNMVRLAESAPELTIHADDLDADDWLFNCANGTLDLRPGGTVRQPTIMDRITHLAPTVYDPSIEWTPMLQEYQQTFMPDLEHWRFLMKILGACLKGGNDYRLWLVVYGPSSSGKGMLIETMNKMLGDYSVPVATSVFRANQDDRPRPDLLRALSARFVYAEEGSQEWELHGDHVKRLTGGDPIVARGMRSNMMVERVPAFTPLIVCNSFPRVKDADTGVRRRLRALTFDHSVIGNEDAEKRGLFMRDALTHTALLTQLVDGCRRAYTEGVADMPSDWAESTMNAFSSLNHLGDFLSYLREEGKLREESGASAHSCWQAKELHLEYQMWIGMYGSREDQRNAYGLHQLNRQLEGLGWQKAVSSGTRWVGKVNTSNAAQDHL